MKCSRGLNFAFISVNTEQLSPFHFQFVYTFSSNYHCHETISSSCVFQTSINMFHSGAIGPALFTRNKGI